MVAASSFQNYNFFKSGPNYDLLSCTANANLVAAQLKFTFPSYN
jgi:hypothetical protein